MELLENYIIEKWFPISVRNSLSDLTQKGDIDLNLDTTQGLEIYKRNLEYLIEICKKNEYTNW